VVSKSSRTRRLERARAERRMARLAAQQRRRRRIQAGIGGSLALALVVLGATWLLGAFEEPAAPVTLPNCTWTPRQAGTGVAETGQPPSVVAASGVKDLVITTNLGEVRAAVDLSVARCGIASVNHLALQGFYNNTVCHSLDTTQYTLTCGSRTGEAAYGPNYQFPNEGLPRAPLGTVSPAPDPSASPDADPNSYDIRGSLLLSNLDINATGAQLIFVYRDGTPLPPDYTEIGRVVSGLEFIDQIAGAGAAGSAAVGKPSRDLTITAVQLVDPPGASPSPSTYPSLSPSPSPSATPSATAPSATS
jgi:peptidyl-prolyl cis-trans isomerase B (cyclophilin B)